MMRIIPKDFKAFKMLLPLKIYHNHVVFKFFLCVVGEVISKRWFIALEMRLKAIK